MTEEKNDADLPFEKALEQLEEIVTRMEEGELPLEKMIEYYERGSRLSAVCAAKLQGFEKKIELLSRDDGKGGIWREFDPESGKRLGTAEREASDESGPERDEKNSGDLLF
ncbi:MAG: exodeoxyribonuclease VII small subunit [Victivallales bacterium]|nr:exodeoxyribonuclease VII small subunit [Victivallales bacterium]